MASSNLTNATFGDKISLVEAAVAEADSGKVTNARKLEALTSVESVILTLPRDEILKQQNRLESLCERLLGQSATQPLRRLVVSILSGLHTKGNSSPLYGLVEKLLKIAGDQGKKIPNNTKVASLSAVGELMALHGRALEGHSTDVFVVVAKHMKFAESTAKVSAFQCLCSTVSAVGFRNASIAGNIWKMLQKMVPDKSLPVRTAAAQALSVVAKASPECASANGDGMADLCKKCLAAADEQGFGYAASSECRFSFSVAFADVLAAMASPEAIASAMSAKKKPIVSDFASCLSYLEQAGVKGPANGIAVVNFRASLCLTMVRLMRIYALSDSASIGLLMRSLLGYLDLSPSPKRSSSSVVAEEDPLPLVTRHVSSALRHVLSLIDSEALLLETIEQVLVPLAAAQFNDSSPATDARMSAVLETLCNACSIAGDGFRSVEDKVCKPLLHLVGNYSNPLVQLQGAYCLRAVAHSSPAQLFQLMSVLLNLATVQNAELLGTPGPRKSSGTTASTAKGNNMSAELQPLLRGLFGHCAALAALVGELFHSDLGVPHDVTSAVLNTARALLQPHPNATITAQRRSCAFILVEALMCLGTDWVGHRLTVLFALWKAALGKKPVERAKALYQHYLASGPAPEGGAGLDGGMSGCRDELLSLLCALRSLHAFTLHSNDTLLTSLPHLHKILVVFLTNVSQLLTALPHPTSASLRAKTPAASGNGWPSIAFASKCGIPEILLMIRSTMYHTFASMLTTQYSSRFVPLLNMLAHDITMPPAPDFPCVEFLGNFLPPEDTVLDLVDPYLESSRDSVGTTRMATAALLATSSIETEFWTAESTCDLFSDAAASCFFCGPPHDGPNSVEVLLLPWDAWLDPVRTLASQCTSPEWDWRQSALCLLSVIMNSNEVSEAPRGQVLMHLLKRRESSDSKHHSSGDQSILPSLAVLMFLREHLRASAHGSKAAPPQAATEHILRISFEGLKEANPAIRRLHVEILSILFYIHYEFTDSSVGASIIQHIGTETVSDSATVQSQSAIALLCGSLLRTFAAGFEQPGNGTKKQRSTVSRLVTSNTCSRACPYLPNVVPLLLKLAKETSQPVRLWMLHAMNISMQAVGGSFCPFLKDALRLATAHLLADLFASPIVLWVISALVQSAGSVILSASTGDDSLREENVSRIFSIWSELQHTRYVEPSEGLAFATVRTEVLCISTASNMVQLAPIALDQLKDVLDLIVKKLAPKSGNELTCSSSCAVRVAAAQCITDLVANGHSLGDSAIMPANFFMLLDCSRGAESQAIHQLIRALIKQGGLSQLPLWIQTLKQMILASAASASKAVAPGSKAGGGGGDGDEDWRPGEGHDDSESMANAGGGSSDDSRSRVLRSTTKVFAVSCAHLLLEQADAEDAKHFEAVSSSQSPTSPASTLSPEQRLVHHLETFIALASHASNSDDYPLVEAGLKLMLLVVERFKHTRDLAAHPEETAEECPLLLVQFEAQVTTCVRHNLLPQANPRAVSLALELLRQIIVERACRSPQRLITLLLQPFTSQTFEADPSFCESTSTRRFLYRLQCACAILDTDMEEDAAQALQNHTKDLARWIEHALRDAAVLIAGLPLQSIKTYQPTCFSLTDYKAVRPCFLETLPTLLRGICALCGGKSGLQLSEEMVSLALGIIFIQFSDRSAKPLISDIKIYLKTMRKILLQNTISGSEMSGHYVLDLLGSMWQYIFCVPQRCQPLLPEVLDVLHMISAVIRQQRQKLKNLPEAKTKAVWLDEVLQSSPDGSRGLLVISSYAFHCVIAALRDIEVVKDAGLVGQALDIFVWWLESTHLEGLELSQSGMVPLEDGTRMEGDNNLVVSPNANYWLWLLFLSPFPIELASTHPAVTLKYWRTVCAILSSPSINDQDHLLLLPRVIATLCSELLKLVAGGSEISEQQERRVVYLFALLAPALVSFCTLLGQGSLELAPKETTAPIPVTEPEEQEQQTESKETPLPLCPEGDQALVLKPLIDDFDMQTLGCVKLMACDLDNTFYPRGMGSATVEPTPEAKEEFDKNMERFVDFTKHRGLAIPVTADSPPVAQRKFDRSSVTLNVEEHPGVFCNGALVLGVGGVVEYSAAIPASVIKQIQEWVAGGDGSFEIEGNRYSFAVICMTKSKILYLLPKEDNPESKQIADDWTSMHFTSIDIAEAEADWEEFPAYQVKVLLKNKDDLVMECPDLEEDAANKIKEIQTALLTMLEEEIGHLDASGCQGEHVVEPWCETKISVLGVSKCQSLNRFIHSRSVKETLGVVNVGIDLVVAGDAAEDLPMFVEWPLVDDFNGEVLEKTERPAIRIIMPDADDETLCQEANLKNKVYEVLDAILTPQVANAHEEQPEAEVEVEQPVAEEEKETTTPEPSVTKAAVQVEVCMNGIREVFSSALQHSNAKSVQTAVSSMQNLLQNPACVVLSPVIVPCLISALTNAASTIPEASLENAYGAVPAMVASLQANNAELHQEFNGAATQMMLMVVVCTLRNESLGKDLRTHKPAIAQCILQLTRADQAGMKAQVARLPADAQQSIQQLLRDHMSAAAGATTAGAGMNSAVPEPKKIELKIKF